MKKNMKKILAFLCAVVLFVTAVFTENAMNQAQAETETSTQATSTEPTPVELYGFENVTLNSLVDSNKNLMEDNEYASGEATYKLAYATNFDKKLFTAWVEFTDPDMTFWWNNRICIGGTASNGWGLSVALSNDGNSLKICDADGEKIAAPKIEKSIEASTVGLDSFLGEEFLLQMGYEYLDCDNNGENNDVRILVYVNGKEGLNTIVENCNMETLGNYVRVSISNQAKIEIKSVDLPVEPVKLDGFTNVDVDDFVDNSGTQMKEQDYVNSSSSRLYHLADNSNSFDKKLFTAYVKFSYSSGTVWDTRLHIGAADQYKGLGVRADGSTLTIQAIAGTDGTCLKQNLVVASVSKDTVNLSSFLDNPFLLQVGYEYIDADSVRILVFVEGIRIYDDQVDGCDMSVLGGYVHLACDNSSSVIGVSNFTEEVKPVTLSSHDTVTISDFQDSAGKEMESKAYDYDSVTPNSIFSLKDGSTSFNEKLLSMKVKFGHRDGAAPSWENRLAIPAADGSYGIFVFLDNSGTLHIDDKYDNDGDGKDDHNEWFTCDTAGVTSFKDNPFILQMSFKDTSSGLELDVYIDGKLVRECAWTEAQTSDYSAKLDLTRSLKDAFIVVSDVDADEFPADPAIMPDSTFERITFGSFGIKNGTYSEIAEKSISAESLHQKVLCGKVKFDISQWFTFRLGGTSEWCGLYLNQDGGSNIAVKWVQADNTTTAAITDIEGNALSTFTTDDAGVKLLGNEYNLMISMESTDVNSDGTSDVKFGVWFADKLYKNQYYYVLGQGDSLGNKFGINSDGTSEITLNSVAEYLPQPDEKYERVTFQHFLVEDGEYESKGDAWIIHNSFKKKDNLDKIIVCGDVLLNGGNREYMLALGEKGSDPYNGIFMYISGEHMTLNIPGNTSGNAYISSTDAGVGDSFVGNQFSLMWSVEFVDSDTDGQLDDVKVQLWFDGFLGVDYTFVDGGTAEELGNTFAVCCPGEGDSITLNSASELIPQPDESLQKLSLPDFVHNGTTDIMESGTFSSAKSDGWYVSGNAKDHDTLDGKVVSFDILQSGKVGTSSYRIRIGGIGNHWYGLVLNTGTDGNMQINWCKSSDGSMASDWATVDMSQAAVSSFVNETFNLMVSMELVEANGNTTSDVKVRIWFNKIPYVHNGQDSFIYYDCGNDIGNILAVAAEDTSAKAFVSLRTVAEYQSNPYYYEEISEYRQGTRYAVPEAPEGYVFSGWYVDENYETPIARDKTDGSAYAKFVDDDVLKVKAQVKLDSNNELPAEETSLRFVTTVDSLNYNRIAFKYQVEKADGTFTGTYDSYASYPDTEEGKKLANKVYTKLYYVGASEGDAMEYKPNAFTWKSMYFKAWNLTGIKANQYGRTIKVTPYWITKDGTIVEGELRELCVNDFDASAWKKAEEVKSVTIDFLGQNTMPIGGFGLWPATDEVNGDSKLFPDYVTEQYFEMFADAGVNLLVYSGVDYNTDSDSVKKQLKYGEKYGIGVFVEDTQLLTLADSEDELTTRLQEYAGEKAFSGIHLVDEPSVEDAWGYDSSKTDEENKSYTLYTTLAGKLKSKYLSYSNMYPIYINYSDIMDDKWSWITSNTESGIKEKYASYVETVSTNMQNDVLSWDFYPFEEDHKNKAGTDYDYSLYFWNMDLIRTKAINQSKPFWAVIQAGSNWNNRDKDGNLVAKSTTEYYPTQSQFNWNVNTSLAYGAKGIQYFPLVQSIQFAYDSINADWDFERNGILSAWGGKTQWYYYAQEMNKQIAAIDEVLMNATNEGVIASGTAATYVSGLDSTDTDGSYNELSSVSNGNALVGCFNYGGKTALYVVNCDMYDQNSTTSQDVTQDITLQFSGACSMKKVQKAKTEKVSTDSNNQLTLTIEAGEGALLVLE